MTAEDIKPGQRWIHVKTNQVARVMAVAKGCVVARHKGAMAWCKYWREFTQNYRLIEGPRKRGE